MLVIGRAFEVCNNNLVKVFERLKEAGLTLKPKKRKLAQTKVYYPGYVVSAKGVHIDQNKLKAMLEYPVPTNVKTLSSFLGLASYYRKFIPHFSQIASPLHALTK